MGNLLEEVKNDILNPGAKIGDILRKSKVLAVEMKNIDFKRWVELELNGYKNDDNIPEYRKGYFESVGDFQGYGHKRLKNYPIPQFAIEKAVGKDIWIFNNGVNDGVGALEQLMESGVEINRAWPSNLVALAADKFYDGFVLVTAHQHIGKNFIYNIIESIKNKLLDFILEIEETYPKVKEKSQTLETLPQKEVSNIFNYNIYGDNNTLASGLEVSQTNVRNDLKALKKFLKDNGITSEQIKELEEAIKKDPKDQKNLGDNVKNWLGNMALLATEGVVVTAIPLVTKAILSYYGIN